MGGEAAVGLLPDTVYSLLLIPALPPLALDSGAERLENTAGGCANLTVAIVTGVDEVGRSSAAHRDDILTVDCASSVMAGSMVSEARTAAFDGNADELGFRAELCDLLYQHPETYERWAQTFWG